MVRLSSLGIVTWPLDVTVLVYLLILYMPRYYYDL